MNLSNRKLSKFKVIIAIQVILPTRMSEFVLDRSTIELAFLN